MQRLELPPVAHKLASKVIKQLRMGRFASEKPKVTGRVHDAGAEMILPNTVRKNSWREGIVCTGNPLRKRETPLTFRRVNRQLEWLCDKI